MTSKSKKFIGHQDLCISHKDPIPEILDILKYDHFGNELRIPIFLQRIITDTKTRLRKAIYSDRLGNAHEVILRPCLILSETGSI